MCQEFCSSQQQEEIIQTFASRPFESVSIDLYDSAGKQYLIMVDRYTGWPFVEKLRKTDTTTITDCLLNWFNDWGIPVTIRSDGGPQFRSEFDNFCKKLGMKHELT